MLLAYIDEIGETGAFVSRDHARFKTSPAFGYAGFIIEADNARQFSQEFAINKRNLFPTELAAAEHPGRWEVKGANIFRPQTLDLFPQQIRVFNHLVNRVRQLRGCLFFHADEKPIGTPAQTELDTSAREEAAMREALNRIARYAERHGSNVLVMIDQINEKDRATRLPIMYSHIFGRAADFPEMKRIVEPPMHIDSALSSNIQFADWVAACVTRAIDYQLIRDSPYRWVATTDKLDGLRGGFTFESKLHLWHRSVDDMHRHDLFRGPRVLYPHPAGRTVGERVDPAIFRKMKAAAERAATAKRGPSGR
ncbi:DUF3800 domain-containing protein [Nocardioides hankookensis]|uniref:DUF3800 domain-containing protein n=1 Tax=Nocardioides hankookensis TaxID=443157 RepID=A0ABW1LM79_9ACTN